MGVDGSQLTLCLQCESLASVIRAVPPCSVPLPMHCAPTVGANVQRDFTDNRMCAVRDPHNRRLIASTRSFGLVMCRCNCKSQLRVPAQKARLVSDRSINQLQVLHC